MSWSEGKAGASACAVHVCLLVAAKDIGPMATAVLRASACCIETPI